MPTLTGLIIMALGIWRITHLIVDDSEDGPYDVLHLIRFFLGERGASPDRRYIFEEGADLDFWWNLHYQLYRAMSCMWCATFWFALAFTILYLLVPTLTLVFLLPFAISAGGLIVNRIMR